MAFQTSISAGHFSALAISTADVPAQLNETSLKAAFATAADFVRVPDIRDMPQFGDPANVVNVPVYGQATTLSINAQADAPSMELTVNYIPGTWAPTPAGGAFATTKKLGDAIGDGISKVFQVAFLSSKQANLHTGTPTPNVGGTAAAPVANALMYFVGKIESLLVTPARDDAMTATIALTQQSATYGPYTVTAA